ncbi:cation:proton antiporter domain-containing protein [Salinarimonas ramus]|uniref:Potassium transporter TrkA n=1 Tax=Salinarimonas ramus TaxID=690164 RepID=A0A917QC29_9HYPH|nr:cation:proton antiporter [Salinarimonas ramus]GGK42057.1 potassium transporter TrkA [Salinarimonas ramus]
MEHHIGIPYLREVIVFLVAAGVMVPLFHRMRVSPVLGYLVVGGVIGPFGLGLLVGDFPVLHWVVIDDLEGVQALAELGVIFLLFVIGLELSLERLWAMRRLVFGLGSAQILITGTIIGVIAWEFGNSIPASIVLGACLALSSTAIVMQLLMQRRRLGTPLGRSSFSILLMQDLAVVPILFVVGVLGAKVEGNLGLDLALALGKAALTIGGIYAVGRLVLRPALRVAAQTRSPEMFMAAILLTIIGISAITGAAGLSMALGAFLAGLLIAETEFRHEVEVDIEPFKGLMLGLFFMSVGMGIDWRVVVEAPFWIFASVVGLFALKSLVTAGLCVAFGLGRATAIEAGLLLGQGGEFAFIVVGLAMSLGLIPPDVGQFMLIVAGLTMLVTPLVAHAAERLAARLAGTDAPSQHALESMAELEGHVVIAGFGRVGRTLVETLQAEAIPFVAIDADPNGVAIARKEGLPVYFGDASRLDLLTRAHIAEASAVVLTMDDTKAAEGIARAIRHAWPMIPIYARARDRAHAHRLVEAGATIAVPEAFEASLQLAGRVLEGFGIGEEVVRKRLDQQRGLEETP